MNIEWRSVQDDWEFFSGLGQSSRLGKPVPPGDLAYVQIGSLYVVCNWEISDCTASGAEVQGGAYA